jgi:hypothetical protein
MAARRAIGVAGAIDDQTAALAGDTQSVAAFAGVEQMFGRRLGGIGRASGEQQNSEDYAHGPHIASA